ncbi:MULTISPECIES: TetR/AcrR family transcriptional regulator [Desulfitobacterium]|uniref:Transcriptional regulator n=1 Tax=Desulfitobacterium dehalogenans (strain ATCC 51507 / DSM 9161 / JW/IU-DC1) TaxID=756499 RepID=I4ACH3_DESDJ|nr:MULTISPECIES: TetR family transcriptional regulator [Desulfitobacterium]AFM01658.1 transcriptional regulator [Desulfitobacterium dehalogenans ATCC 51507]
MKKSNRQLQKEQTKETLLNAAYQLFSKQGIMNTRMSDIAQAAGVSHGTVFAHFQTQEMLITEVIETYGEKIALHTHEAASTCEHMEELLAAHLTGIGEFELFYTRLVIENRLLPPGARDVWISIQSAISFHFSQVAQREIGTGQSIDLPLYFLFNTWIGLVHHYLANGDLFAPEGNVVGRYGDTLVDNYVKMIRRG